VRGGGEMGVGDDAPAGRGGACVGLLIGAASTGGRGGGIVGLTTAGTAAADESGARTGDEERRATGVGGGC
jgi:hypothetical protein